MTAGMQTPADLFAAAQADIATLRGHFKGKRLEVFDESMAALRESAEQGAWVSRGALRVDKGVSKGIAPYKQLTRPDYSDLRWRAVFRAASYGHPTDASIIDEVTDDDLVTIAPKVPAAITRAWLRLLVAVKAIAADLDASRSAPVYTDLGLSPKVTETLRDAGLDLDLRTRRLCPLGWYWETATNDVGDAIIGSNGSPLRFKVYFPKWPEGTVFGSSRFSHCDCHACGKSIPSGKVVPVLVADKAGTTHGFWFGRDCAANILGIKDAGIDACAKEP